MCKNKPILLCFSAKYKTVTVGFLYVVLGQSVTKNPFVPLFSFVFFCVCLWFSPGAVRSINKALMYFHIHWQHDSHTFCTYVLCVFVEADYVENMHLFLLPLKCSVQKNIW